MEAPPATVPKVPHLQQLRQRILVLGAELHTHSVTSYAWNDLPERLNVTDYDVVILNLTTFLDQQNLGITPERLPSWQQLARLLFSQNTEIICIGIPGIEASNSLYQSTTWWLPVTPDFEFTTGEAIEAIKPEFSYYFQHVRRWFFCATPKFKAHFLGLASYLRVIHPQANHLRVGMGALARTRLHQAIGFKLMFRVEEARPHPSPRLSPNGLGRNASGQPFVDSGLVIWLPPPTEITPEEAINLILQHRYRRSLNQTPPDWVNHYGLPQKQAIALKINQYQQAMRRLSQKLEKAQRKLEATSGYNRLLYEPRAEALALVVAYALRTLGAQVHPCKTSDCSIRFRDPQGREGLFVAQARPGALLLDDLRQLDRTVRDRLMHHSWQGKGVLIANTEFLKPPEQRHDPFSPNCIQAAQQFGYCLITTPQLFQALAYQQQGTFDQAVFWDMVFTTNGICPLPNPAPQLESADSQLAVDGAQIQYPSPNY